MKRSLTVPAESISALMTRDPELYARIVELLEAGHSPGGVAALTNTNIATVRACRELVIGSIHAGIRKMGYDLVEAAQRAAERLVNEIDAMPLEKLPSALAILLDKSLLIHGQPTVRVEVGHVKAPDRAKLLEMYEALHKRAKAVEIEGNGSSNRLP